MITPSAAFISISPTTMLPTEQFYVLHRLPPSQLIWKYVWMWTKFPWDISYQKSRNAPETAFVFCEWLGSEIQFKFISICQFRQTKISIFTLQSTASIHLSVCNVYRSSIIECRSRAALRLHSDKSSFIIIFCTFVYCMDFCCCVGFFPNDHFRRSPTFACASVCA